MGTLVFIGLGLFDERDLTFKALDYISKSKYVFMEEYTSRLMGTTTKNIEKFINKEITLLARKEIEESDIILEKAERCDMVSFLVPGDPMTATTHAALLLEAKKKGIKTILVPNASIYSAAPSLCGLQHYKFGRTTTLVEPEGDYFPKSPYYVIKNNLERGEHTLVLLDIKIDEKKDEFFLMSPERAISLLKKMEKEEKGGVAEASRRVVIVGNAGSSSPVVVSARFGDFKEEGESHLKIEKNLFPVGIYSLIIPGNLHFLEKEILEMCDIRRML